MPYVIYDVNSGEIQRIIRADHLTVQSQSFAANEIVAEGDYDDRFFYFVEHEAQPRPKLYPDDEVTILADGVDKFTITDIPPGTEYRWRGVSNWEVMPDTTFEFTSAIVGVFQFEFKPPFPYQRQIIQVMANAS